MTEADNADLSAEYMAALIDDDPVELYESAPCAYLSALPNGMIVKVNGTFLDWTGYQRDELVHVQRWPELLARGDQIFFETHFSPALLMQGQVREIAAEIVTASGARLPVLANATLKLDEAGEPLIVRVVLFDARERRSYESELLAARLRAEESEQRAAKLAQTLQAGLLPPKLIKVPGFDLGAGFRPSGDGSELGGDFYDAFAVSDSKWALALGDVCGKGVEAAVVTALVRYTIRNEALRADGPADVLAAVHEGMLRYHPDDYCTAIMVMIERTEGESEPCRVRLSLGGHHPALRFDADRTVEPVGVHGPLLGIVEPGGLVDSAVDLPSGAGLVLFTDGVVEARTGRELFGTDRLRSLIASVADRNSQEIADAVVTAALEYQDGVARDDIAVLVVKAQ